MKLLRTGVCILGFLALLPIASFGLELASASGALIPGSPDVQVIKIQEGESIRLVIRDAAGAKLFESEELGSEDRLFTLDGKPTSLALRDLTGDGVPEAMTAAFYGPRASGLFVFTYDASAKTFVPVRCTYPKHDLTRDMLVSDLQQGDGSDMIVGADGTVTMLGLQYPENDGAEPVPAAYTFIFKDGMFVHQKTEPLPAK
ncbi:MAG TPA: hypothetical protein PLU72_14805 [Candidatus Ozemobacteraceae bacterium]|nr:hypothetical protein [Candidatus Ozemobacteraceae bacterium]HQG29148.1 hypothetical protein [Candidatus Ozemobacteraceae bacterium]